MKTLQSLTRVELSPNGDSERYRTANPFPSIIWRDFWDDNFLALVAEEVAAFSRYDGEKDFYGSRKKRYCGDYDKLPARVRELIDFCYSRPFIKYLEDLTGERDLHADPYLEGGGIHSIAPGGFLKIHADYNWHKRLSMYRRLNLLIYLNRGWQEGWGGALELWDSGVTHCVQRIYPEYNTSVLFTTDDLSFHGHPEKLCCPEGVRRHSIALYYFSPNMPPVNFAEKRDGTNYVKRYRWDFFKGVDRVRSLVGKLRDKVHSTDTRR